jgi:hypothetical protein
MKKHLLIGLLLLTSGCNLGVPSPTPESTPQATLPSAPTTVPATATFPATETAVPTPEPPALYFTDEFDIPSPYWEFLQTGGATALTTSIENGSLRIDASSPDTWFVGIHTAHSYSDVFVRAKTSIRQGGSVGLICHYSADGWYEFNAASDGTYNILLGQWLSPGVAKYIPIINESSKQLTGSTTHELGLFCEGGFLQLFVNGTIIRRVDVTNYGLTEGQVGITASSFTEVPMSAIFEWVAVGRE